jgi:hypothetical protein
MNPWTYLRRRTKESVLAGFHDAIVAGGTAAGLTDEQAAQALQALTAGTSPATQTAVQPGGTTPQLTAAPEPTDAAEVRRGPGRPRKFQEPPQ